MSEMTVVEDRCGRRVGRRPYWMGVDQYDPCHCLLAPGHEPPCKCSHDLADGAR